mmetsp:Transcript_10541/g.15911  ORF Transcript_10541/g.15911 Transcript_10541/m.15911 type:complete len:581 (+) Transcript_10541:30-1772(+)
MALCEKVKFCYKIDTVREIVLEHPVEVLKEVSFVVPKGKRALLIGKNGAGKTSLLKILAGVATPDSGRVMVMDRSWSEDRRYLNMRVVLVGQTSWGGSASIEVSQLLENAKRRALEEDMNQSERLQALAFALRVDRLAKKGTDGLSDGERRSVQLFVALATPSVELVLLDEACMELDVQIRSRLYQFLQNWKYTVIYATHVFDGVEELGLMDTVIFLTEDGVVSLIQKEENKSFYHLARHLLVNTEEITAFSFPSSYFEIARTNLLTWAYNPNQAPALRNISINIGRGQRVVLIGQNGSGKSTLLALLGGAHLTSSENLISVFGDDPRLVNHRGSGRVALLGGSFKSALASLPQRAAQIPFSALLQHVKNQQRVLHLVSMLEVDTNWRPATASSGQQTRMQLVLQLSEPAELYLVDELTRDLDLLARDRLLYFLAQDSATVIYATHIFQGLNDWATNIIHIRQGQVVKHPESEISHKTIYQLAFSWLEEDDALLSSLSQNATLLSEEMNNEKITLPIGWKARDNSTESSFGSHAWSARTVHGHFADRHSPHQRFEALYLSTKSSEGSSLRGSTNFLPPRR